jgi:hypothetical protein
MYDIEKQESQNGGNKNQEINNDVNNAVDIGNNNVNIDNYNSFTKCPLCDLQIQNSEDDISQHLYSEHGEKKFSLPFKS